MNDNSEICALPNHMGIIRVLSDDDIAVVTAIYGHHVETSTASFETEAPSIETMAERFAQLREADYPALVAVDADNHIMGFAYAGPYKPRAAYSHTVEDSIYIHPDYMKLGIGKALLTVIIDQAYLRGYKQMMAVIGGSDNHGSINLHKALDFTYIGTAKKIGLKFNKMVDVVFMQLELKKR